MKPLKNILSLLCFLCFLLTSCRKELPLATQEGRDTFGCLIDGKLFTKAIIWSPGPSALRASYEYHYPDTGVYYFSLSARLKQKKCSEAYIYIRSSNLKIEEGKTYILENEETGKMSATCNLNACNNFGTDYNTTQNAKGELKITRFDPKLRIVSGNLSFNAVNSNGQKVEVREGRFDIKF